MTDSSAADRQPLRVAVLYKRLFDPDRFLEVTRDCARPIELAIVEYEEGFVLRNAKANRLPREKLRELSPALGEDVRAALRRAEVVQALDVPLDLAELAPQLRWVQAIGAGIRHLYPEELAAKDIALTSAAGVSAGAIAEFVMARLLEVNKNLPALRQSQLEHRWEPRSSSLLSGSTLGVIGFGAIGQAVARLASAFGMSVLAVRRRPPDEPPDLNIATEIRGADGLDDLLKQSDVVVIAVPETATTTKMIGERELALMPAHAILCNVSRGSVVDEHALKQVMREGRLRAAILDVMEEEPLSAGNELWDVPNTHVSPHCAGSNEDYAMAFVQLFASNLHRYTTGQTLLNRVDPDHGY